MLGHRNSVVNYMLRESGLSIVSYDCKTQGVGYLDKENRQLIAPAMLVSQVTSQRRILGTQDDFDLMA
jgi:hypothetical protein